MKPILLVVDMQNDFISGALGSERARALVPQAALRISQAARAGWQVIFTQDTHGADYLSTHEGKLLPVAHCVRGTPGWELAPEIEAARRALKDCEVIPKGAFGSTALEHMLAARAQGEGAEGGRGMIIEIIGLCTDICVVSNALLLRAVLPEADISVNAALCAGVTPEKHLAALETLRSCQVSVI